MIRIYLDWDIISKLKTQEFNSLFEFIKTHKRLLQFPYSPAHFNDLMKSYKPENEKFFEDLDNLEYLAVKHFLRWGKDGIEVLSQSPKSYFEYIRNNDKVTHFNIEKAFSDLSEATDDLGIGELVRSLKSTLQLFPANFPVIEENKDLIAKIFPNLSEKSSFWDLLSDMGDFSTKISQDKELYIDFRKTIGKGMKINPIEAGNWEYDEVFKNIDEFLSEKGLNMSFVEYVELSFKQKQTPYNIFEFYTTAYILFDLIGFKKDKLPKDTDSMQNIRTDSEHSFYGAHCDYFVVLDRNLKIRSKALYHELNISTKVIDPNDLIGELEKVLYETPQNIGIINEALDFCNEENFVEFIPESEEYNVKTFVFKSPRFYFNFFNYLVCKKNLEEKVILITFKKVFKNLSRFVNYSEMERVIDHITDFFGCYEITIRNDIKQKLIYSTELVSFDWQFDGGLIRLLRDPDTERPILQYFLKEP
jgi:hypothetical protein